MLTDDQYEEFGDHKVPYPQSLFWREATVYRLEQMLRDAKARQVRITEWFQVRESTGFTTVSWEHLQDELDLIAVTTPILDAYTKERWRRSHVRRHGAIG